MTIEYKTRTNKTQPNKTKQSLQEEGVSNQRDIMEVQGSNTAAFATARTCSLFFSANFERVKF